MKQTCPCMSYLLYVCVCVCMCVCVCVCVCVWQTLYGARIPWANNLKMAVTVVGVAPGGLPLFFTVRVCLCLWMCLWVSICGFVIQGGNMTYICGILRCACFFLLSIVFVLLRLCFSDYSHGPRYWRISNPVSSHGSHSVHDFCSLQQRGHSWQPIPSTPARHPTAVCYVFFIFTTISMRFSSHLPLPLCLHHSSRPREFLFRERDFKPFKGNGPLFLYSFLISTRMQFFLLKFK
jgi:hypothetical protein